MNERAYHLLGIPTLHEDAFKPAAGRMKLYGKSGPSAPSPDPAIGQAALQNIQLGKDWLDFANKQFEEGNIRQADLDAMTKQVTQSQLDAQTQASQWATEDRDRYKSVFQPLQDQYIDKAKNYGSQENQEKNAAEAVADVKQQGAAAQAANTRSMAAMGINPNSGRFNGISRAQETLNGLSAAGAANTARQATRDKGDAMLADAVNMGNGMASQAAGSLGLGVNAGSAAVGNQGAANQNFYQNGQVMQQGFQGAIGANQSGAGILNQQYGSQVQQYGMQQQAAASNSSGMMSGIGAIAGAGLMAF